MSEIAIGNDSVPPAAKRMRSAAKSVYFAPIYANEEDFEEEITAKKTEIFFCADKWFIWSEEAVVDGKKVLKINLIKEGKFKLANAYKVILRFETDKFPEGKFLTFDIENPLVAQVFEVDVTQDDSEFRILFCELRTDPNTSGWYSAEYKHEFDDADRPHDIVLNFENDRKLYCNKVVLAHFSNYFDRLFFSETADKNMKSCDLPDLNHATVGKLLNACLSSYNAIVSRMENIVLYLELAEKYKLECVPEECARVFHNWCPENKKNFFTEHQERLRKLNFKTLYKFMNEGFQLKGVSTDDFNSVFSEELGAANDERNIDNLVDATLLIGDKQYKVHKDYLAFFSPYFDRLFFDGLNKSVFELTYFDPAEFTILLKIIYSPRDVEIDGSNVDFLLKLAYHLEFDLIISKCVKFLSDNLHPGRKDPVSPMEILKLVDKYNLYHVEGEFLSKIGQMSADEIKKFRSDNFAQIGQLTPRMLCNIIQAIAIGEKESESEADESNSE